jgi:signal transduction histidine kinase
VLTSNPSKPQDLYAVKLSETVRKAAAELNLINGGRIELKIEGETTVFALPAHLHQLVSNLLSNAAHYSDKKIECLVSENSLVVRDFGPGLPAGVREHLGQPFNRGTSKVGPSRGSGLGLAWVSALCEKYKWRLNIDSGADGTRIEVTFSGD